MDTTRKLNSTDARQTNLKSKLDFDRDAPGTSNIALETVIKKTQSTYEGLNTSEDNAEY